MDERPDRPPPAEGQPHTAGDADLLTIGLLVFFVALILTVGALLLAPAFF